MFLSVYYEHVDIRFLFKNQDNWCVNVKSKVNVDFQIELFSYLSRFGFVFSGCRGLRHHRDVDGDEVFAAHSKLKLPVNKSILYCE
jgi:hypothetical protein